MKLVTYLYFATNEIAIIFALVFVPHLILRKLQLADKVHTYLLQTRKVISEKV